MYIPVHQTYVSNPHHRRPPLVEEWVVPLPWNGKGNILGDCELHFIKPDVFLALSREHNGRGGSLDLSSCTNVYYTADNLTETPAGKQISGATGIDGSEFDRPANLIAVRGMLDPYHQAGELRPFRRLHQRHPIGEIWVTQR
jgi:hypothetical protein